MIGLEIIAVDFKGEGGGSAAFNETAPLPIALFIMVMIAFWPVVDGSVKFHNSFLNV